MSIAAVESRMAQIESTLQNLSAQRPGAGFAAGRTGGPGGIIGSGAPAGLGAGAVTAADSDEFAAALDRALGGTDPHGPLSASSALSGLGGLAGLSGLTGTAAVGASGSSAFGDRVVETAKKHLGVPYVWGGTTTRGFDCSGLVQHVMAELGVDMPRVARDQAKVGTEVPSLAQARPGDLLGMRNGSHIAIYLGNNKILHAPRPGEDVSIRSLQSWDDIDTIRRVTGPGGSSAAEAGGTSRAAFEQRAGA